MKKFKAGRLVAFLATVGVTTALIGASVYATGAYFSDTKSGTVTTTLGSIKVSTSNGIGTNGLDFNFTNILPGVSQTATGNYTNSGRNVEDVWLVFNDATQLHALNQLGTYGEVHISNGFNEVFGSYNLNDGYGACPTPGLPGVATLCPLPTMVKLYNSLAVGATGTFSYSFNYASKLKNSSNLDSPIPTFALPYQVVATQVGITPGS